MCDWHHVVSIHSESPGFLLRNTAVPFTVESDKSDYSGFSTCWLAWSSLQIKAEIHPAVLDLFKTVLHLLCQIQKSPTGSIISSLRMKDLMYVVSSLRSFIVHFLKRKKIILDLSLKAFWFLKRSDQIRNRCGCFISYESLACTWPRVAERGVVLIFQWSCLPFYLYHWKQTCCSASLHTWRIPYSSLFSLPSN